MLRMERTLLFWEDVWLKSRPLCVLHPVLYEWCEDKFISVFSVLYKNGHLNFSRWLPPNLFEAWMEVLGETFSFHFVKKNDTVSWKWCSKKVFTTKSVYGHLTLGPRGGHFTHIWKAKIPYKIKIFTWLVEQGAVLTKDNMVKRKAMTLHVFFVIKWKL